MNTLRYLILTLGLIALHSCSDESADPRPPGDLNEATAWGKVTLDVIKGFGFNSPTFTSRSLGYIGVTMYETVVHGSSDHKSLVGQLNGLNELTLPESGTEYNWVVAMNAGQARIIRNLYANIIATYGTSYAAPFINKIDSLETAIFENERTKNDDAVLLMRSRDYGRMIADEIYEWSKTDGGHEMNFTNFDFNYEVPTGPGYWKAPFFGQSSSPYPLHPHWGNNRTFAGANASLPIPEMIPYSTNPASAYYQQFVAVYLKRKTLTQEEKNIAVWWADDPAFTYSPPGHSYNLATQYLMADQSSVFTCAEVYAKVGMAVADAFINCWKCKYYYHAERPAPYIIEHIDADYEPFWPEPPFPAFSSGHATQSAAAARALISVFGNNFPIVDRTNEPAPFVWEGVTFKGRSFSTIWQTAEECAYSRFLGGIHTDQDNDAGTDQGIMVGDNIVDLQWKK